MACNTMKIGNSIGIICSRGKKPKKCQYCYRTMEVLCDFPVGKTKAGKTKTCDAPMCLSCTQKGVSKDVDFCKSHYPIALAAYQRRTAKEKTDALH